MMYLPSGNVYFDKLTLSSSTSELWLEGTELTIGDALADTFNINSGSKIYLNFSNSVTELAVYGDYPSSGPATNIQTYLADGRIRLRARLCLQRGGALLRRHIQPPVYYSDGKQHMGFRRYDQRRRR